MMIVPLAVITMMVVMVTKFRVRSGYRKASLAYYQQKGQFDPTPHLKNRQFELFPLTLGSPIKIWEPGEKI